jgi:hypothetical protein
MKNMEMRNSLLIVLFIQCISFFGMSQKIISNQENAWVLYTGNHKISKKLGVHTEYQWRRADLFNDWQQSLLRVGLDYYHNPNISFTAGYASIISYQYGEQPISHQTHENRIWEQVNLKSKYGRFDLQHRYRMEQRLIDNWTNSSGAFVQGKDNYRNRVRYRMMVNVPLSRKEMANNTLFLNVNDEVFLGFGKGIAKNVLDQNRFIAALGWRFSPNFNIQLGYLNQMVLKTDGIKVERNHTLWLSTTYNIDFTKFKIRCHSWPTKKP